MPNLPPSESCKQIWSHLVEVCPLCSTQANCRPPADLPLCPSVSEEHFFVCAMLMQGLLGLAFTANTQLTTLLVKALKLMSSSVRATFNDMIQSFNKRKTATSRGAQTLTDPFQYGKSARSLARMEAQTSPFSSRGTMLGDCHS